MAKSRIEVERRPVASGSARVTAHPFVPIAPHAPARSDARADGCPDANRGACQTREVVSTVFAAASLGSRADEWDALVDASPHPSPFLRSWWLDAMAGPNTEFVLVVDDGRLTGGIALDTDRRRGVARGRIPGTGPLAPHNLDLVASPGTEAAVCAALFDQLGVHRPWITDFYGIRPDCHLLSCSAPSRRVARIDGAPWLRVPPDFEQYVSSRPTKLRQEIRRVIRRLDEAGYGYRVVGAADTRRALDTLEQLHRGRWGSRSHFLPAYAAFADAAEAGARRGEVAFQEIVLDGAVVASLVTLEVAGVSSWYQMGRDPDPRHSNVGTLLKARAVERSCRAGHRVIDLCIGEAPLKAQWADCVTPVLRLRWASGRAGAIVLAVLEQVGPRLVHTRR
jgi:CelD/BcsL family acetyltransferase involved in cellulose biosynthesis